MRVFSLSGTLSETLSLSVTQSVILLVLSLSRTLKGPHSRRFRVLLKHSENVTVSKEDKKVSSIDIIVLYIREPWLLVLHGAS